MTKTKALDIAQWLETDEDIKEFLAETAREGTNEDFIHALNIAARAKGMSEIAKQAGLNRQSLYRSLSEGSSPKHETVRKVVEALGCKLTIA